MIKIDLINGYYIKKIDPLNWGLCIDKVSKSWKKYYSVLWFYPNIESAWRNAVDKLTLSVESFWELISMIDSLKKLKASDKLTLKN